MVYILKERKIVCKRLTNYVNLKVGITSDLTIFKIKGPLGDINFAFNNKTLTYIHELNKFFIKNLTFPTFHKRLIESVRGVLVP